MCSWSSRKVNVMDTLEGCDYVTDFRAIIDKLSRALRECQAGHEDAPVLDFAWELINNWKGFGGRGNEQGDGMSGFVVKNFVYQGMRNVMHALGFARGASRMFFSGPNPCQLAAVYGQREFLTRGEQFAMYREISYGIESRTLSYGDASGDLKEVDFMVLQDNLCKTVEVFQTTTTGCCFGKARKEAVELYAGVPCSARRRGGT